MYILVPGARQGILSYTTGRDVSTTLGMYKVDESFVCSIVFRQRVQRSFRGASRTQLAKRSADCKIGQTYRWRALTHKLQ